MGEKRIKPSRVAPMDADHKRPTSPSSTELEDLWRQVQTKGLKVTTTDEEGDGLNELDKIKQLEAIKQMPVPINTKIRLRDRLYEQVSEYNNSGCGAWKYRTKLSWKRWKIKQARQRQSLKHAFTLWNDACRKVDGLFGSGVGSYFRFLRMLFILNLTIFLFVFVFITIPQVAFNTDTTFRYSYAGSYDTLVDDLANSTNTSLITWACNALYEESVNSTGDAATAINDFLQGTGWMEITVLFYGRYSENDANVTGSDYKYDLPLAYLLVCGVYMLISLLVIVKGSTSGYKNRLMTSQMELKMYSHKLFTAWDYSLTDKTNCLVTQNGIWRDFMLDLEEERRAKSRKSAGCGLYTKRFLINLFVMAALGGAGYLIYFTTIKTVELTTDSRYPTWNSFVQLLIQYMTSLTISLLNAILPVTFKRVVKWEDYTPAFMVNMTLLRTVFLKLASLTILIITIYSTITCSPQDVCRVGTGSCSALKCWETYVGQEMYKLIILDFLTILGTTLLVEFPRRLIVDKCDCAPAKKVGRQEFDITKNVLDLIYNQTLMWLGTFFAPLISAIMVLKMFFMFYIKYLTVMFNYKPNSVPYRASDSQAFFMYVLLTAFILVSIPIFFVTWKVSPSRGCGPFRDQAYMVDVITLTVDDFPTVLKNICEFITSVYFLLPLAVYFLLIIYYNSQKVSAYQKMTSVLKDQLVMEGQDKKFLLNKLSGGNQKENDTARGYLDSNV